MTLLDKDAILGAEDITYEEVDVPQWGGKVRVRSIKAAERDSFEDRVVNHGISNIRAFLCVRAIVDEKGNRIFKDSDAAALGEKSGAAVDAVFAVARRLSGLTEDEIDQLEKNSEATQ